METPIPATSKISRTETAYDKLKSEILSNRMPPGYQATEPELAIQLAMSRTPVREALIRLEADGLLEVIPRRGIRVLPVSPVDMKEIYEILTALEPEAAAALARNTPTAAKLAPLIKATERMEQALQQNDLASWAAADDDFHRKLVTLHDNHRLTSIVSSLLDQAHRARNVTLRLRTLPAKSTQEHRLIVEHIQAGEADAVTSVFRAHRKRASTELLEILKNYQFARL